MSLDKLQAGDYGQEIQLTYIDVDTNAAADISAYSDTLQIILVDPSGNAAAKTAAFENDGTDGIISYTLVNGDLDEGGKWHIYGRAIATGTAQLTTETVAFYVGAPTEPA